MNRILKVIDIPEECVGYVEQLQYEMEGHRKLAAYVYCAANLSKERRAVILNDYFAAYAKYKLVIDEIRQIYVPPELQVKTNTFVLDYPSCQMVIRGGVDDGKHVD